MTYVVALQLVQGQEKALQDTHSAASASTANT